MKDVIEELDAWTARGDAVAIATVMGVKRSAPRPPGAKMAVNGQGEIAGAVSGGCVEGEVVLAADDVADGARGCCTSASRTRRPGTSACPAGARSTSGWSATSRARCRRSPSSRAGGRAALVTVVAGGTRG